MRLAVTEADILSRSNPHSPFEEASEVALIHESRVKRRVRDTEPIAEEFTGFPQSELNQVFVGGNSPMA